MVSTRPDRRISHGFVLDVVPLLRWPGNQCDVQIHEIVGELSLATATASRLDGVLTAESMADSLTVSGVLDVSWTAACRRCLEPTTGCEEVAIKELYERRPVEGETYELSGEKIDLEPMIREAVLLGLPLAPLCREDCTGPLADGSDVSFGLDVDAKPRTDPRWAALSELAFEDSDDDDG